MMKKLGVFLCGAVLTANTAAPVFAQTQSHLQIKYDSDINQISVLGNVGNAGDKTVTISIAKSDAGEMGKDNTPMFVYLYNTENDGRLELEIPVSGNIESYTYNLFADCETESLVCSFSIVNPNDLNTIDIIEQVNEAKNADEMYAVLSEKALNLGIDIQDDDIKNNIQYISALCFEEKKEYVSFDAKTLCEAINKAIACSIVTKSRNLEKAIKNYDVYFGTTYDDYLSKSDEEKNIFNSLFSNTELTPKNMKSVFSEKTDTAEIICSDTWSDLQDKVINKASNIGIDISSSSPYSEIKEQSKYKIFTAMFSERKNYISYNDIVTSFNKAVSNADVVTPSTGGGSGGGGGGGNRNVNSSPIGMPAPAEPKPKESENAYTFSDIDTHWAKEYIISLAEKNIISGFEDNTFRPDNNITRAEFVKMIVSIFKLDEKEDAVEFEDVSRDSWYYSAILKASGNGVIYGSDGRFNPEASITRQDAAVIICRLKNVAGSVNDISFTDENEISDYALEAVKNLAASGIIIGNNGRFNPKNNITRAEAATMLYRILN